MKKYIEYVDEADAWWGTLSDMEKQSVIGASYALTNNILDEDIKDEDVFIFLGKAVRWFEALPPIEQRGRVVYAYFEAKEINPSLIDWEGIE